MKKRILSAVLCITTAAMLLAGCGGGGGGSSSGDTTSSDSASGQASTSEGGTAASGDGYVIGYNNFGVGAYPLDLNASETKYAIETAGSTMELVNDNFTVDNIVTDMQNLIGKGVDGITVWVAADTLYNSINDLMLSGQMPFALGDKFPTSDETIEMLRQNPYFVGAVSTTDYDIGAEIAQMAFDNGAKTAIIVAAAVGDTNHDARVKGFKEKFTELGGEVVNEVHCADPSEAVQKSSDALSANGDADCLYGSGGDYSVGALSAMSSLGIEGMPVYGTDIDPNVIEAVRDGRMLAANGACGPYCGTFASLLLINYLDGHQILDENGQAPVTKNVSAILVTKDNVDNYEEYWINNEIFTTEELQSLLYRYNPDVTWADFEKMINEYGYESRMATKN